MMIGSYHELLCKYIPKPIESEADYDYIQSLIDKLLDMPALTDDQMNFLTLLGLLIERYEHEVYPDLELRGIPLIKALLDDMGLKQKDLVPIFKAESTVSAVLNGHRRLKVEQIGKLAAFFQLPHSHFFERNHNQLSSPIISQTNNIMLDSNSL